MLIREWHTMTAAEQTAEWDALTAWVIWVHDLYELSREERLPLCWPEHPGLVEELRSLKAWRDAVYDSADALGAPHAARSWHGELRQTVAAATGFWAPGCRTGHTGAALLAAVQPDLAQRWRQVGPPLMASAPEPPPVLPAEVSRDDMQAALRSGDAQRHSRAMPYYAFWSGVWWARSQDGTTWMRCTDPGHIANLDRTSRQIRGADAAHDKLTHGKDQ
ncbi:hypothetical protein [Dactylosporangium sp. NPDC000521]|uniref:hypothetical protein n=1 Tax=Dactylosporangium sp. NPDC000521 TaxID=3363975 RepID=UPI0036B3F7C6